MAVMWSVIFYTVLAVAAFYFILLQPVLKNQKAQRKAVREMRIGDEVVTTGGIVGEVKDVVTPPDGPTEIILEIAPGVRVRALTDAIARRLTTLEPEPALERSDPSSQEAPEPRA
ncbi:MAG: preprotein translocase subunit YajC [Dehalococcoidia bacterium]|nr:MAG: preprotein translocase subunit YajC [bacterium]MCE7928956.1 preprotein translocase subunit YajC [Chloroflexi bacterium CFX7]MCK6563744.1 preprotein translocase subunit YajC [Dehalococcoidia bacterium]MCL4230732.1 preprotein translocase subunit YajC [Dehalococcoidia bacterium]NUQ54612.1 preprotein translocase subunit YajC [Dehalococcoidia bacterium]